MKLNIRYDDEIVELELDTREMEQLWVSFSLEQEDLPQKEKESRIQEEFDKQFNQPEYKNLRKFARHRGFSKARPDEDEEFDTDEPLISEVRDPGVFSKYESEHENKMQYDEVCAEVREILKKKPKWAEAFIAVRLDEMTVNDFAASIGEEPYNISKYLTRAEKKLKEFFEKRQI